MVTYLACEDFNLIEGYLSEKLNCQLLSTFLDSNLPVSRIKLTNLFDLGQEINTEGNIFSGDFTNFLIDIDKLEINEKGLEYIGEVLKDEDSGKNYFFYSSSEGSLNAASKKMWQKIGSEIVELKKADESLKSRLGNDYSKLLALDIGHTNLSTICKQAKNYSEILDSLDFIDLANNKKEAIDSIIQEEEIQLFMLGFDLAKVEQNVPRWYKKVPEDDLQFALSLIFGKIEKQSSPYKTKALREVILADKNIKTRSKISPNTWWKLCLWNIQKQIVEA